MKARIVRIGNSQGIRIPKRLMAQVGLRGEVEIAVNGKSLIIRAAEHPRAGWAEAFRRMAENGDDVLLEGEYIEERAQKGSRRKLTKAVSKVRDAKHEPRDAF